MPTRPSQLLALALLLIVTCELIIMLAMEIMPWHFGLYAPFIDTAVLALSLIPILWIFLYKPMLNIIKERDSALDFYVKSEQRFIDIAENANEWFWEVDVNGKYTYTSPVAEKILGMNQEDLLNKHFYDLFHPDDREYLKKAAFDVFATKQSFNGFINRNIDINGNSVWLSTSGVPVLDEEGNLLGYRGCDVVKHGQAATTDHLTGLLNREGFYLLAEQQIAMATRNKTSATIIFADLDDLKWINDTYGHNEGDQAIKAIAGYFVDRMRESDIIARLGGDEFLLMLTGSSGDLAKNAIHHNIVQGLSVLNNTGEREYTLSLSIGIAFFEHDNPESLEDLIIRADKLMYEEKWEKKKLAKRAGHQE